MRTCFLTPSPFELRNRRSGPPEPGRSEPESASAIRISSSPYHTQGAEAVSSTPSLYAVPWLRKNRRTYHAMSINSAWTMLGRNTSVAHFTFAHAGTCGRNPKPSETPTPSPTLSPPPWEVEHLQRLRPCFLARAQAAPLSAVWKSRVRVLLPRKVPPSSTVRGHACTNMPVQCEARIVI